MTEKTNKLNIYLIKGGISDFSEIIKDDVESVDLDGVGAFYWKDSISRPPSWLANFFKGKIDQEVSLRTSFAQGVLLVPVSNGDETNIFAVTFGFGRNLLREDTIEERFGLKVTLNSVASQKLRSIDRVTLGSPVKQSREQISSEGDANNFGVDVEQDLIRSVTGRSIVDEFGKSVTGRDSFSLSAKYDVDTIASMLNKCLINFRSTAYKTDFDWIDHITELKMPSRIAHLNDELSSRLQTGNIDRIWMVPPDIVEWSEVQGFKYFRKSNSGLYSDLSVVEFQKEAAKAILNTDFLKHKKALLISATNDSVIAEWSIYRCMYAEIEHNGSMCILNAGKWYEISSDFTGQIKDSFNKIPNANIVVKPYEHADEAAYNKALAASISGAVCLDADMITYGGGKSSIEFCDILTPHKQLIHVKRYSGSAQLSHLFSQGVVAGELFASDEKFRLRLNDKLPASMKFSDCAKRPNPNDYEVIFGIVSKSKKPLDVPFFSKITLRNAYTWLRGYGYKVTKLKIPIKETA